MRGPVIPPSIANTGFGIDQSHFQAGGLPERRFLALFR
jgi:hypothetical protein